jgi:hypothetical protein
LLVLFGHARARLRAWLCARRLRDLADRGYLPDRRPEQRGIIFIVWL